METRIIPPKGGSGTVPPRGTIPPSVKKEMDDFRRQFKADAALAFIKAVPSTLTRPASVADLVELAAEAADKLTCMLFPD